MRAIIEHIGDKVSIYLLTLLISGLLLFYYFYYVPSNRSKLDAHAIRILDNKAGSIKNKYNGYVNAVNSAPISYLAKWYFYLNPSKNSFCVKDISSGIKSGRIAYADNQSANTQITRQNFEKASRVDRSLLPEVHGPETQGEAFSVFKVSGGTSYFVISSRYEFNKDTLFRNKKGICVNHIRKYPYLWVDISNFTEQLKKNDFFDDLFLVRANYARNSSVDKPDSTRKMEEMAGLDYHILDKSSLDLVRFNLPDTAGTSTGEGLYNRTIGDQSFRVYYKLIKLRRGLDVYAVGLVPVKKFNSESLTVPPWFVVFSSLAVLILIFLFPVLKLFLLNKYERLSTYDISLGVFSVILCACLLILISIGSNAYWGIETEEGDHDLKILSDQITKSSRGNIRALRGLLDSTKLFSSPAKTDSIVNNFGPAKFNELFSLSLNDGTMSNIYVSQEPQPDLKMFPVNLAERNYYKAPKNHQDLDYAIDAIDSYAKGISEVAISRFDGTDNTVKVVTSSLPSLIHPGMPSPYKFIVVDRKGAIKFRSDWSELNSEDLLKEAEAQATVKAYLDKGGSGFVDFNYLRSDCRGYQTPLVKNWSLLVYYETSNIRNLAAEVFMMCLVSLTTMILYLTLIHQILKLDNERLVLLKTKPFLYDWLNPFLLDRKDWHVLFAINTILFCIEILATIFLDGFINLLTYSFAIITIAYILNYKRFILSIKNVYTFFWLIMLLVLWLTLFVAVQILGEVSLKTTAFFSMLLVIPIVVHVLWKEGGRNLVAPTLTTINEKYFAYRIFMFSWLLAIAIGPTYGFLVKHYHFENMLYKYAHLLEDTKSDRGKLTDDIYSILRIGPLHAGFPKTEINDMQYYYRWLRRFANDEDNIDGLKLNFIPDYEYLRVDHTDTIIQVTKEPERDYNAEPIPQEKSIYHQSLIHEFHFGTNLTLFLTGLVFVSVIGLIWWLLQELPRKIFYIPKQLAWEALKSPDCKWGEVNFEYANNDQSIHPLHHCPKPNLEQPGEPWKYEKEILGIQARHKDIYTEKWKNTTDDEKLFLYDLAEDGVANQVNDKIIGTLAEKGLIRLFPNLEVVNVSFANFIREEMNEQDIEKIELKESSGGRWSNIRVLLIIIIVAAFAFLSVAGGGFLAQAAALIGSITLFLPNLLSMIGAIAKIFTKSAAAS